MTPPVTRQALQQLYHSFQSTARTFQSYNFREYFLRSADTKFKVTLPKLLNLPPSQTSFLDKGDAALKEREREVSEWVKEAEMELQQLKRAAAINNLYEAPRLVVEGKGNVMTQGGGGAGMEQAAGGAGQPVDPKQD